MKIGIVTCCTIGAGWVILAIIQLWLTPLDPVIFLKISITAGLLLVAVLVITIVIREYWREQKMQKDGYID